MDDGGSKLEAHAYQTELLLGTKGEGKMMDERENHPVDRLARVREQIKELTKEEAELKAACKELAPADMVGRWYELKVKTSTSKRINMELLHAAVDPEIIDRCKVESEVISLTVHQLDQSE